MTELVTTTHLSIQKTVFKRSSAGLPDNLCVSEVAPDYARFDKLMVGVGAPWRWDKRPAHVHQNAYWRAAMHDVRTRLFILMADEKEIGLCLAIKPRQTRMSYLMGVNPIEIKYFGLFLEETGHGYGGHFLHELLARLFQKHDEIYLSTRSTNHAKVVSFYRRMGMSIVGQDVKEDDTLQVLSLSSLAQGG